MSVTTTDNDSAGLALDQTAVTVSESGTTATFTVALTAQPDTNVELAVSSGDNGAETVSSPALWTFMPAGWNIPPECDGDGREQLADRRQPSDAVVIVALRMATHQMTAFDEPSAALLVSR